jgi:hypothetical protein
VPSYTASIAAAVALVGADLFTGEVWARSPVNRVLTGSALRGSAAAGDTEVELMIDEVRVSSFFNTTTGFPNMDDLVPLESLFIPAGALLRSLVRDAATTNPINHMVSLENV